LFTAIVRLLQDTVTKSLATIISAYLAFALAESFLHVSGVMSVLVTGLILGHMIHHARPDTTVGFIQELWEFNAFVANALVFLLMGVVITTGMFEERWLAMLIGIGGVLVARATGIYLGLPLVSILPGVQPIRLGERTLLFWGGVRGAVTLALALSLPVELDYWWTVQSIAFGVVLFTLFVQAPTLPLVMRQHELSK